MKTPDGHADIPLCEDHKDWRPKVDSKLVFIARTEKYRWYEEGDKCRIYKCMNQAVYRIGILFEGVIKREKL